MKSTTRRRINKAIAIVALFCMTATQSAFGALLVLANQPLFIGANVPPQVMLDISKDQQLYKKAYNDYTDLDGDGQLDTTYKHSISYYGYFDPTKCYDYNTATNRYEPASISATKYCSGNWSGNFLNWVSMSRMDTVRKLLYGGLRSTDTSSTTVLERSYLPTDAHAWAKYYNGTDIAQLTPFNPPIAATPNLATTAAITNICGADSPQTSRSYNTLGTNVGVILPGPPSAGGSNPAYPFYLTSSRGIYVVPALSVPFQVPPLVAPVPGAASEACIPNSLFAPWATAGALSPPNPPYTFPGQALVVGGVAPVTVNVPSILGPTNTALTVPTWDIDIPFTTNMTSAPYSIALGDQIRIETAASASRGTASADCSGAATACMTGAVLSFSNANQTVRVRVNTTGVVGADSSNSWYVTNLSRTGISFCNLTSGATSGANSVSQTNSNPPLIRVAQGNFQLWNASERWQCYWSAERAESINQQSGFNGIRSNGNLSSLSGITASAENPSQTAHGLGSGIAQGQFVARVQTCVAGLFGTEDCKQYPNGNYKPIGLLQKYGDVDLIQFGLMTGSYTKNISGGVLRKNIGTFTNEVNVATDGTFVTPAVPPGSPRATNSAATPAGIVNTLNYMRIWGYYYGDGTYLGGNGDNCTFQLTTITQGSCTSWGNPMAEIYFESLRYFAGNTPTAAYTYGGSSKDNQLGLPLAAWTDPLNSGNYCAPINVLAFNASVSTNDDDLRSTVASSINSGSTAAQLSNTVGTAENITYNASTNNVSFFVGKLLGASATPAADPGFELCTPKQISGLGDVSGICPEGPTQNGSYLMPGLAHFARTNRIRNIVGVPGSDTKSLKATTYGIQLSSNVPQLIIPVPGSATGQKVVIQPLFRLFNSSPFGGGTLVDLKVISQQTVGSVSTGKVYINWEDSEQGGDYDQDMWGTLEWSLDAAAGTISVKTAAISQSTNQPCGFGYSISGTTKDGPHFHSGILTFNYNDVSNITVTPNTKVNASGGCASCQVGEPATTAVYTLGTATANTLQDPMWYAAKYGAFVDSNGNNLPDLQSEWDSRDAAGQPSATGDGTPDTYFLVINPLGLVSALDRAFTAILSNASASSVATNSTSLQTGTTIYQARFNANDWSGQVLAFTVGADGTIAATPTWDAGQIINFQDPASSIAPATTAVGTTPAAITGGRAILTYNGDPAVRDGVPFRWPANPASPTAGEISLNLVNALNLTPGTAVSDGRGQQRLAYLRGDQSQEGTTVTGFRERKISRLGDIVNSNPNFIAAPNAGFGDAAYVQFRTDNINRKPVIYVGGNDGMLHAFRADDGRELLAYVPGKVQSRLNTLTDRAYVGNQHRYYVDGSPEVGDAFIKVGATNQWRTVLVSGLGVGGQGLFALDVTTPDNFSEANAASIVMWEFTDADDPDLGYVVGQPAIRKMANGRWAAIVPGGYNNSEQLAGETACTDSAAKTPAGCTTSSTGAAYLFIIFLDGPTGTNRTWVEGTDYIKIKAPLPLPAVDTPATPNGLSQPLPADVNADGFVDYIYAGDLRGQLWKFDVTLPTPLPNTGASLSPWTSSSNRVILFTARDPVNVPQPITAKPEGTLHPSGGFIITFGTGKYLEPTDPFPGGSGTYQVQSFYGIWDKSDATPISGQTVLSGRSQLLEHDIALGSGGVGTFRVVVPVSGLPDVPDWSSVTVGPPTASDSPPKHMGWFLDFPSSDTTGERSVFRPILTGGRLIFNTLLPLTQACLFGGTSFTMVIDPTTGGRIDSAVLDVSGNGLLNSSDTVTYAGNQIFASGVQSTIGITPTPTIIRAGNMPASIVTSGGQILGTTGPLLNSPNSMLAYALSAGSSGSNASTMIGLNSAGGRVSWRELLSD